MNDDSDDEATRLIAELPPQRDLRFTWLPGEVRMTAKDGTVLMDYDPAARLQRLRELVEQPRRG